MQEALEGRHKVDPSGQIIKLPVAGCPWKEHLAQLEEEQQLGDAIKFCLYEVGFASGLQSMRRFGWYFACSEALTISCFMFAAFQTLHPVWPHALLPVL